MTKTKTPLKREPVQALIDNINERDAFDRLALAKACGSSLDNLRQIAYGYGSCSLDMAKNIVSHVPGVTLADLIPSLKGVEL